MYLNMKNQHQLEIQGTANLPLPTPPTTTK
jgi:hypothetical protein